MNRMEFINAIRIYFSVIFDSIFSLLTQILTESI